VGIIYAYRQFQVNLLQMFRPGTQHSALNTYTQHSHSPLVVVVIVVVVVVVVVAGVVGVVVGGGDVFVVVAAIVIIIVVVVVVHTPGISVGMHLTGRWPLAKQKCCPSAGSEFFL
jgi:hypothetical protein